MGAGATKEQLIEMRKKAMISPNIGKRGKNKKTLLKEEAFREFKEDFKLELRKQLIPEKVIQTHIEALDADKIFSSHTEPDKVIPDHSIRLKAVELAYEVVKSGLENNKQIPLAAIQINFKDHELE